MGRMRNRARSDYAEVQRLLRIENLKLQYSVASVLGGSFRAGLRNRCDKDVEGHPYFLPESRHTDSAGEPSRRNFRIKRTSDTESSLQDVGIERARHGGIFPAIGRGDVPAEQESVRLNNVVRERRGLRRGGIARSGHAPSVSGPYGCFARTDACRFCAGEKRRAFRIWKLVRTCVRRFASRFVPDCGGF